MLGKEKMATLRYIAKLHNLAAGSQTVPNFVAEIAAAQGNPLTVGPTLPAIERKKLPLNKTKRKTTRVVFDEEEDESSQEGLVSKRNKPTVAEPPSTEGVTPDYAENPSSASTPFESARNTLPSNASAAGNS